MKRPILAILTVSLGVTALAGELTVTSAQRNGTITWTNSVSNAVYQVQWSNSITGSWSNFGALTSLDTIESTNSTVSAQVPVFYRVAAQTPRPNPAGLYKYESFDATGAPFSVGWLLISVRTNLPGWDYTTGTWSLGYSGRDYSSDPTRIFGKQLGNGVLAGSFDNNRRLVTTLTPQIGNDTISVVGTLQGNQYTGTWNRLFFTTTMTNGTFSAQRVPQ